MRYPIYVFFLMSGFFYLTGNPFSDETSKTGESAIQGKVAKLKYGRRVSASSSDDKTVEATAKTADAKPVVKKKLYTVAASSKSTSISDAKMQPSAVVKASEPSSVASIDKTSPASKFFAQGQTKRFKDPARKPIDWTVFGNKRKNAALTVPVRTRSQDEIDAQGIADEPRQARKYNPRKLASKSRKYKRAKLKRKKLRAQRKARKARKARKVRKAKRLARLKRRSKGVYRIARKAKKKSIKKKKIAYNKPRRKKFGFSFLGAQASLSN